MEYGGTIGAIIEGLQGVAAAAGGVKDAISDSVATGVEQGVTRAKMALLRAALAAGVLVAGVLMLGWGVALMLEAAWGQPGLGFIAAALLFIIPAAVYLGRNGGQTP